jgi:hypothetical protein
MYIKKMSAAIEDEWNSALRVGKNVVKARPQGGGVLRKKGPALTQLVIDQGWCMIARLVKGMSIYVPREWD